MSKNSPSRVLSRRFGWRAASALLATVLFWGVSSPVAHASVIRSTDAIDFGGNNVTTDSFDSADAAHSTNGAYPFGQPEKTLAHGDVLTDATIFNAISIGNAIIKGRVATGLNGSVNMGSSALISGPITDDMNAVYPSASIPAGFSAGGIIYNNLTVNGVTYAKAIVSSGDYVITSLSGSLYLASNITCRIKVTGNVSLSGTNDQIRIASGAQVKIYMQGATLSVRGKGIVNENPKPDSLMYFGLPSNTALTLHRSFTGVIYAPQAAFSFGSGGNEAEEFVGSVMAKSVQLNSHVNFHFDENLYRIGPFAPTFTNQPQSQTILPGDDATFTSAAIGPGTLSYQWYFWPNVFTNWVAIPGATNAALTVTNPGIPQSGFYRVVATNGFGSTTSTMAQLKVAFSALIVTSKSPLQFSVAGLSGLAYAVETSTNLIDWERTVTNTTPFNFIDTNIAIFPQRFYRAVYLP